MVEHVFSHVPAALPEADFTRRWEKRLRRRRRRERIQWFLAISSSLAIAIIAVSAVLWSQVITEARQYIMVGISMFFTSPELISLVEGFRDGLILFGRNVYPEILIVPLGLVIWGMVWGSSLFWLMTVKPQVLRYGLQT
jgi:predicted anti-sigma-YlaC factor YlaD